MNILSPPHEGQTKQSKIRILHVIEATTGGTRKHLSQLLGHLDQTMFELSLIYSNERDPHFSKDLKTFATKGIVLFEIPMRRQISPWNDLVAFWRIYKTIRAGGVDIVHVHSSKAGFLGRLAAKFHKIPAIIYSPHGFAFQYAPQSASSRGYLFLERIASGWGNVLLCVSTGEREVAISHKLALPDQIAVIPNAVSSDDIQPKRSPSTVKESLGILDSALVVGMVAQFRPQKGLGNFFDAIPAIVERFSSVKFLLVGDGPLFPELKRRVATMGIDKHVILTGHCEDVADYYQIMDVFASSSLWEGMPYVILEAMNMALPIVATDVTGNNELVLHGENGFLVTPEDSGQIADRVIQLLADKDLRQTFGKASRMLAQQRDCLQECVQRYQTLYSNLVAANTSGEISKV